MLKLTASRLTKLANKQARLKMILNKIKILLILSDILPVIDTLVSKNIFYLKFQLKVNIHAYLTRL